MMGLGLVPGISTEDVMGRHLFQRAVAMKRYFPLLLLAVLAFTACDAGAGPEPVNPLIGTWVFENDSFLVTITFEENTFTANELVKINSNTSESAGSYTYTDTIVFYKIITGPFTGHYSSIYKIYDDEIYLSAIPLSIGFQTFKKQL